MSQTIPYGFALPRKLSTARTCVLVTDSTLQSQIPDLLTQWEQDRANEGWIVLTRIVSSTDALALRATLASVRPDHTFLIGDDIPHLWISWSPDGHQSRAISADFYFVSSGPVTIDLATNIANVWYGDKTWGAIGRVWFKSQASAGDTLSNYKKYLGKRHNWEDISKQFNIKTSLIDHLNYGPYVAAGNATRPQTPVSFLEDLVVGPGYPDGGWQAWVTSAPLIGISLSGGQAFNPPGGLYYCGGPADWRSWGTRCAFPGFFGSFICQIESTNSMPTSTLTDDYTIGAFYDMWGQFQYGGLYNGDTFGDCGRAGAVMFASPSNMLTSVMGDPTVKFTQDQMSYIDLYKKLKDNQKAMTALKSRMESYITHTGDPILTINCGSAVAVEGWMPDQNFQSGLYWTNNTSYSIDGVEKAAPLHVYDTCRTSNDTFYYIFPNLGTDPVLVNIHFCEVTPSDNFVGARAMDIDINGVVYHADPFALAGAVYKASVMTLTITPDAQGTITIHFSPTSTADPHPLCSAIGLYKIKK